MEIVKARVRRSVVREDFGLKEVLIGGVIVMLIAVALQLFYPTAGAAAKPYIHEFNKNGILVLNRTEPVLLSVTPFVPVTEAKQTNLTHAEGDFVYLNSRESNPKLYYRQAGKWKGPETGQQHLPQMKDLSCYRIGARVDSSSIAVTKSFSGRVLIMEKPDVVTMCFTGGFLCSWRTFVNGKLVESDDYIAD